MSVSHYMIWDYHRTRDCTSTSSNKVSLKNKSYYVYCKIKNKNSQNILNPKKKKGKLFFKHFLKKVPSHVSINASTAAFFRDDMTFHFLKFHQ